MLYLIIQWKFPCKLPKKLRTVMPWRPSADLILLWNSACAWQLSRSVAAILHADTFTHSRFYTHALLHTDTFTHNTFTQRFYAKCIEKLSTMMLRIACLILFHYGNSHTNCQKSSVPSCHEGSRITTQMSSYACV